VTEEIQTLYLTKTEAIACIKKHRKGRRSYLRFATDLYTVIPDGEGSFRGYPDMSAYVPVSIDVAVSSVHKLIGDIFEEKGVKIRVSIHSNCIFIG